MATKTSPHDIALGFSIGTFIAILPLFGMGVLVGIAVVFLCKKISKYALFAALAVWNPLTLVPTYSASFMIGNVLFGAAPIVEFEITFAEHVYHFTRRFLVGNIILTIVLSLLSYFLVRKIVEAHKG